MGNAKSIRSYVDLMEKLFILKTVKAIDINDLRILAGKQKSFIS
jgi:predicted AAA+ superfamily ATPase